MKNKKDKLIKFLFKYGNIITNANINELLQIDENIDLNQFDLSKTKFDVLYDTTKTNFEEINSNNSRSTSLRFPFKYKIKNNDTLMSDMNYFFKNLDKIVYIKESKKSIIYNWSISTHRKTEIYRFFHIKFLDTKKTKKLKGFKFLLHSTTTEATNINNDNVSKYYVNGVKIEEKIFKKKLRKKKIKKLI
jgi:hypothetical protein